MDGSFASGLKTWLGTKDAKFAREIFKGLAVGCPLSEVDEHCPLKDVRSLPMEKRLAWLNDKSDAEITNFFSQHFACLKKRE